MFTADSIGVVADGALDHQHIRDRLADLLTRMFRHHPRGGEGICWSTASALVDELRGEMSDDASEEEDAINMLNEKCVSWECFFEMVDGDLMIVATDEYAEMEDQ